ncbi:hypothetical protein ABT160_41870 [Streptomyces sp. NPDC001941]|uniref:hypothetical protein n=1 Tax=Streptomyces sp. NPDC001941 TaxID=3154659 RepID=UPI003318DBF5
MADVTVRAQWGPRKESTAEVAERLWALLRDLGGIAPETFADWDEAVGDPAAVAAYLAAANPPEEERPSQVAILQAARPGAARARVTVMAGGEDEWTVQSVSITLGGADGTLPPAGRLPEVLAAIAGAFDPDWGDVHDDALFGAVQEGLGLRKIDPRCGRAVLLSAARAALVPDGLAGRRVPVAHGGLLVDFAGPDGAVATDTVLAATEALRATGALAALPRPLDRPKL